MDELFVSGQWSGFYVENHQSQRGWMHLYLAFENQQIKGEGTDYVGPWTATGTYDRQTGDCEWTKRYVGKHQVKYRGKASKNGIQGTWKIVQQGPFHIWPKSHGHFNELYLREEQGFSGESGPSVLLDAFSGNDLV